MRTHTNSNPQNKTSQLSHRTAVRLCAIAIPRCSSLLALLFPTACSMHLHMLGGVLLRIDVTAGESGGGRGVGRAGRADVGVRVTAWAGHWGMRMDGEWRVVFTDTVLCLLVDHA